MSDPFDELFREITGRRRRRGGDVPHEPGRDEPGGEEPEGDEGRGDRARPVTPARRRRGPGGVALLAVVVVVVLLVLILGGTVVTFWTDSIWYSSVGYAGVFWTRFWAQVILFFVGGAVALAFLFGNLWIASRNAPPPDPVRARSIGAFFRRLGESSRYGGEGMLGDMFGRPRPVVVDQDEEEFPDFTPVATWILIAIAALVTFTVAVTAAGSWQTILLWLHRVPYDPSGKTVPDPIFGLDLSFYLFDLPFLQYLQAAVNGLLLVTLLLVGARYAVGALRGSVVLTRGARIHLAVLGALFLLTIAAGYQLDRWGLVYSTRGVAAGVGAADAAVSMTAFQIMTALAIVIGAVILATPLIRRVWPLAAAIGVGIIAQVVVVGILPNVIESLQVKPNEFAQEQPYITNNINMTRLAYDLTGWSDKPYSGTGTLTQAQVQEDATTFENARLWDYRPLQATLDQLQTVRQYYTFVDVDTDRYTLQGAPRQVMLSAREIAPQNNTQAQSWVNLHITYTHGYGVAMVPVNQVTPEGLPDLVISNMPTVSTAGAPTISQPRIYFGEQTNDYVIVDARQPEFDYPVGSSDAGEQTPTTSWSGTTGINLGSPITKLLFSLRLGDLNLLISDQLTDQSSLLFNRALGARLQLMAPFLQYDYDPYVVVTGNGGLAYIQDAYTTTSMFPNAQPFDGSSLPSNSGLASASFDYIRNSVKVVMNAYDGTTTFYVADPNDPLIRAWEGVFPGMFKPLAEMPSDLKAHLRQPEDLFNVQTRVYATYHVTDPQTFYTGNDLWTVPQQPNNASSQRLPLEPYYVEMRMPGAASSEFLLLQPMVPKSRPNMIAWVAARNDGENYGQVVVYHFPKDTTIFGPAQIEARIDQDPTISGQITLWNQSGSSVVWGNLIVVPIQDSLLYLEPVYLQSTGSAFPEFQKIVVASPTKVVWANTLADALNQLIGSGPGPTPTPTPSPSPGGSPAPTASAPPTASPTPLPSGLPTDVKALVDYASAHYSAAQEALKNGDFATYGAEMAQVKAALDRLSLLVGPSLAPSPSAVPAPSPSR